MISTIKSPSKSTSQFNRHMDSSLKVTDILQLFKLDKISFFHQISYNTPMWELDKCNLLHLK